jgi:hypothetical protein
LGRSGRHLVIPSEGRNNAAAGHGLFRGTLLAGTTDPFVARAIRICERIAPDPVLASLGPL